MCQVARLIFTINFDGWNDIESHFNVWVVGQWFINSDRTTLILRILRIVITPCQGAFQLA